MSSREGCVKDESSKPLFLAVLDIWRTEEFTECENSIPADGERIGYRANNGYRHRPVLLIGDRVTQSSFQDFGRVGVNWRKRRQGRQRDIHRQRSVVELDPYDRIFAAHRRARDARKARTFADVRVRVPFVWSIKA